MNAVTLGDHLLMAAIASEPPSIAAPAPPADPQQARAEKLAQLRATAQASSLASRGVAHAWPDINELRSA